MRPHADNGSSPLSSAVPDPDALVVFEKRYKLGVPDIDRQHMDLFEALNQLHRAALSPSVNRRDVEQMLASLRALVIFHFDTEEQWMKESWYPDYVAHKAMHDQLTRRILEMESEYSTGDTPLSTAFLARLKDWLAIHVADADLLLAEHLRHRGW